METIEILGYIASLLIGISLGLIGSGGSILTVPILVYLFSVRPELATAYSLFIVGGTALVGSFKFFKDGLIHIKTSIVFAIPSIIGVYSTRKFIVPAIPDTIFTIGDFAITKDLFIMVLFAVLMILSAFSMIKGRKNGSNDHPELTFNYPLIALEGIIVGGITGLVGAGGGFLIIPALVLLVKLPMKMAIGSSLIIIAAKSLIGFLGDIGNQTMDWTLLLVLTGLAVAGIFIGSVLSKNISNQKLKPTFGYFVLVMGIYIIGKELIL